MERLDSLQHATLESVPSHHDEERDHLFSEVASIRTELRLLASQVSGVPVIPTRTPKRMDVQKACPNCGPMLQYRQKSKAKNVKGVKCTKCGARLCSREADGDFIVGLRTLVDDNVTCPSCGHRLSIKMDPVPGSVLDIDCIHCKVVLRISRGHTGLRCRIPSQPRAMIPPATLGEEFLQKVADLMVFKGWAARQLAP